MPRPYGLITGEGTTKIQRGLGFADVAYSEDANCYQSVAGLTCVDDAGNVVTTPGGGGFSLASLPSWFWWVVGGFGLFMLAKKR